MGEVFAAISAHSEYVVFKGFIFFLPFLLTETIWDVPFEHRLPLSEAEKAFDLAIKREAVEILFIP